MRKLVILLTYVFLLLFLSFSSLSFASASYDFHATNMQYTLANRYAKGQGIKQDLQLSFKLYEKAAEANHLDAQLKLGYLYDKGIGVEKNVEKSLYWFRQAALSGYPRAQYKLGWALLRAKAFENKPEALAWLSLASENGSRLSDIYRKKLTRQLSAADLEKSHFILLSLREEGL